jgi:hypothetical protein
VTQTRAELEAASTWIRSAVADAASIRLFQVEPWATVYTAASRSGTLWFKVCAPTHAFEVPLTASLSSRWPSTVTDVLAHDVDRRWLLMADAGQPLRMIGNPPEHWEALLPAYAELQIGETAHVAEHLSAGTPDLRLDRLPALYEDLLRSDLPLDPGERDRIVGLASRFGELCRELGGTDIEASVQHDDLHMNNVYVSRKELRVLDWGDASIGHPFFSLFEVFRFLREFNRLSAVDPWFARLRDAYLEPWGGDRRDAFALARKVGGFAHAIAWLHQRDALPAVERPAFDDAFATILRLATAAIG